MPRFQVKYCLFPPPEKSFPSNPDALPIRPVHATAVGALSPLPSGRIIFSYAKKKHCLFRETSRKMQCFYTS
ncbi:hypothetical protein MAHJHV51_57400 [Mycobacterium avium subsp. hominissuis]